MDLDPGLDPHWLKMLDRDPDPRWIHCRSTTPVFWVSSWLKKAESILDLDQNKVRLSGNWSGSTSVEEIALPEWTWESGSTRVEEIDVPEWTRGFGSPRVEEIDIPEWTKGTGSSSVEEIDVPEWTRGSGSNRVEEIDVPEWTRGGRTPYVECWFPGPSRYRPRKWNFPRPCVWEANILQQKSWQRRQFAMSSGANYKQPNHRKVYMYCMYPRIMKRRDRLHRQ